MKQDDILNALDIVEDKKQEVLVPRKVQSAGDTADRDFDYARENIMSAIEQGTIALEGIVDVASQSQHPRAYEVVSTLINSITNSNKELLNISKIKRELQATEDDKPSSVNNNLFISTADLQKMLRKTEDD